MRVDVYKASKASDRNSRRFLFVPEGSDPKSLPREVSELLGNLQKVRTMEIQPGEKRIALDTDEAISDISQSGYHVEETKIEVNISVGNT